MLNYRPKWFQYTVPSSGTRFIKTSFENAGHKGQIAKDVPLMNDVQAPFVWTHPTHAAPELVTWLTDTSEQMFVTVRNPIETWGTNFKDLTKVFGVGAPARYRKTTESITQTAGNNWRMLLEFCDERKPYIHRVDKDSLEDLGKWAGLDLTIEGERFSKPSRLKQAILDKDVERIEHVCEGTGQWEWFRDEATPLIADFYENLGYDLWWKNG